MPHDFDHAPERRGTDSLKWARYAGRDVLPLWVADMDFAAPPEVVEAVARRVAHGVFGYASPWPSLVEATVAHLAAEYGWSVDPSWLVWLPGVVTGLNVAARAVEGAALAFTPVYPRFLSAAAQLVTAALRLDGDRWTMDLAVAEEALTPATRLLLLCHPHNPVGRAWDEAELQALAELAATRDLVVCSDEIHCGLVLDPGRRHRPFATLSPDAARRSITLMAPSKTFNVSGLGCAFAVIPDVGLRRRFEGAMAGIVPHVNVLGLVACEAAFRHGAPWRAALLEHLRANRDHALAALRAIPGLRVAPVEATYLAWIDASGAGLGDPQPAFEAGGVGLSGGRDFGPADRYRAFVRLNFGCTRAVLDEALARMARTVATARAR